MSYDSWGRNRIQNRRALPAADLQDGSMSPADGWLPFGNGKSYGDSCHNDSGCLIDSRDRNAILSFDDTTGVLTCEAGVLLSDILTFAIPRGYFLPVTPGTQYVTVAGAIANDVHGKNHHLRGSFGAFVNRVSVLRSDGVIRECSPEANVGLFAATIGGMGLTGLILEATIRLTRVESADVQQHCLRFEHIDAYFDHCDTFDEKYEYSVAWLDQLASGRKFGRGLLLGANHSTGLKQRASAPSAPRFSVPFTPPLSLINRLSLTAFNALYFNRERAGQSSRPVSWKSYFYPLDAIGNWNRLYGPKGLFQHQSVYPLHNGRETTVKLMECAQSHGHGSFLTVLKRFGDCRSPALLSFARPGFTLTLDFANQGQRTQAMLDALDDIVVAAGGAINPYKDARMSALTFQASFPNWRALEARRDPAMMSDFWRRTAMQLTA